MWLSEVILELKAKKIENRYHDPATEIKSLWKLKVGIVPVVVVTLVSNEPKKAGRKLIGDWYEHL